jgi:hypothetical protein
MTQSAGAGAQRARANEAARNAPAYRDDVLDQQRRLWRVADERVNGRAVLRKLVHVLLCPRALDWRGRVDSVAVELERAREEVDGDRQERELLDHACRELDLGAALLPVAVARGRVAHREHAEDPQRERRE